MYTIFGSTGFIGKELSYHLKKKGKEVFLPNKKKIKFKRNLGNVIYCVGSDDWQKKTIKGFFSNFGHLQQIVFNNNFKSLVFLSTTRLYINTNSTAEDSDLAINSQRSNDYYNILKIASESLLLKLNKKIKILRLSNVFGFNYKSPLLLPSIIRNSLKRGVVEITISQNSTKDYVHIDDVMQMIFKIQKKSEYNIYNIASGKNVSIKKILNILKKKTNCKIILKNQKKKIYEPKINIKRIQREFKFKPKFILERDLPSLISQFKFSD
tara:strand:+ start:4288 stop:5088 length:801 start_codon:yes stop_codon:yes gene_type:complete